LKNHSSNNLTSNFFNYGNKTKKLASFCVLLLYQRIPCKQSIASSKRIVLMVPFNRALSHFCSTRDVLLLVSISAGENGHTDALSRAHESMNSRAGGSMLQTDNNDCERENDRETDRQTGR
jgi:hypothetical protein